MTKQVYVTILWHMHQPVYNDPFDQEILLPFVRLHAVKSYYEMIMLSNHYDNLLLNYNLVPSLIDQLQHYSENQEKTNEKWLKLTIKCPEDMSQSEKLFIINNFFLGNVDRMISPLPYFYKLYHKALKTSKTTNDPHVLTMAFSNQEIRDIQVLHLISWTGHHVRKSNPEIAKLIKKQHDYTNEDKLFLLRTHFEIIGSIIDTYKKSFLEGKIEISASPYYHPILPLLIDTNSGIMSSGKALPEPAFKCPYDAEYQIASSIDRMKYLFDKDITGFWPSEGSLSDPTLELFLKYNILWVATDEGNLYKSKYNKEMRYFTPYIYKKKLNIFFRNHSLSDKIGFVYSQWNSSLAVEDFISHIYRSAALCESNNPIIPIILDGENCWEYYNNNGHPFLSELYERLISSNFIKTITFRSYLEKFPEQDYKIFSINPGSWINDNYDIWIGNSEENTAWKLLKTARENITPDEPAYNNLLIAEGSDWFWWYGEQHSSRYSHIFDRIFRRYLKKAYSDSNSEIPETLDKPIKKKGTYKLYQPPKIYLNPTIDGKITNYYEWLNAGFINISEDFGLGAIHQRNIMIHKILYGFNKSNAFLMMEFSDDFKNYDGTLILRLNIEKERSYSFSFKDGNCILKQIPGLNLLYAYEDILEIALPIRLNQEFLTFKLSIIDPEKNKGIEHYPIEGYYRVKVPSFTDYADFWYV